MSKKRGKGGEDDVDQVGEEDGKEGSYQDDVGGMRRVKGWTCAQQR